MRALLLLTICSCTPCLYPHSPAIVPSNCFEPGDDEYVGLEETETEVIPKPTPTPKKLGGK